MLKGYTHTHTHVCTHTHICRASQMALKVRNLPANAENLRLRFDNDWEVSLEEIIATHSSILAWRIPWTEEPGGYSPWGHKESDIVEAT